MYYPNLFTRASFSICSKRKPRFYASSEAPHRVLLVCQVEVEAAPANLYPVLYRRTALHLAAGAV